MLLTAASLSAQYTVKRMVFQGAGHYSQKQLEAVAGLHAGQHISTKEMSEASQRLMDTGAFADIETTLNGPIVNVDVVFKLKMAPLGGFLPVSFENFPWFTQEEREAELQSLVPLYTGRIPAASNLQAAVQAALKSMLEAKGIQATVDTEEEPSTETRPTPRIVYRVTEPKVVLHDLRLGGVNPALAPQEKIVLTALSGQAYRDGTEHSLRDAVLTPYLDAGYIDATVTLQRTPQPAVSGVVNVDVAAMIVGGDAYRVASITWAGSDLFSIADFAKGNKLQRGDVASDKLLRQSYQPILNAYLQRGFVDVSVDTQPQRDTTQHTVAYALKVAPGEVYKVGSLSVAGLSPEQRTQFDALWTLQVGAVYDGVYALHFLPTHQDVPFLRGLGGGVVTIADPDTKLVDIQFAFAPAVRR